MTICYITSQLVSQILPYIMGIDRNGSVARPPPKQLGHRWTTSGVLIFDAVDIFKYKKKVQNRT